MNEEVVSSVIEIALGYFNETLSTKSPEDKQKLALQIRNYILHQITFQQLQQASEQIIGFSQPLDHLREIMEISPDPIPDGPDENQDQDNGAKREKSRPWSVYEDQRLIAGIMKYGLENWTSISRFVGNRRTRAQCSQRWTRGLDPKISKAQWTQQEENALLQLVQNYGNKAWTIISVHMRNRSDVQCRYKYKQLLKEKRAKIIDPSIPPEVRPNQQMFLISPYSFQTPVMPFTPPSDGRIQISQPILYQYPTLSATSAITGTVPAQVPVQVPTAVPTVSSTVPTAVPASVAPQREVQPKVEHHKTQPVHQQVTTTHFDSKQVASVKLAAKPAEQSSQPSHYIPLAQSPIYNVVPTLPPMEPNSTQLPHVQNVFSYASPLVGSPMQRSDLEHKEAAQPIEHVEVIRHEHTSTPHIAAPAFNAKLYSVY